MNKNDLSQQLVKDIESLLDSWYLTSAPKRSEDLQKHQRPGSQVPAILTDQQPPVDSDANSKIIGNVLLPPSQWSHSLQQLNTGDPNLVLFRAEFAQPTRHQPVPLITASVFLTCNRQAYAAGQRTFLVRFEEHDYQWRVEGSVSRDAATGKSALQWTGMGGVNPMKWLTELIRSKSQLPFKLQPATVPVAGDKNSTEVLA